MIHVKSRHVPGFVGVTTGSTARFNQFWDSLEMLEVPEGTVYLRTQDPFPAKNRNAMTRTAKEIMLPGSWVYYLDDDHEFSPQSLMRKLDLMKELGGAVDVIGSLYVKKFPPYEPVVYRQLWETSSERFTWKEIAAEMKTGAKFLAVAACGAAGLLVSARVINDLVADPWFPEDSTMEDIDFCAKVTDSGAGLIVDLSNPIGHTNPVTVTPEWYEDEWLLRFNYGDKGYRLPTERFHP